MHAKTRAKTRQDMENWMPRRGGDGEAEEVEVEEEEKEKEEVGDALGLTWFCFVSREMPWFVYTWCCALNVNSR